MPARPIARHGLRRVGMSLMPSSPDVFADLDNEGAPTGLNGVRMTF
jgi:hypothetical protein